MWHEDVRRGLCLLLALAMTCRVQGSPMAADGPPGAPSEGTFAGAGGVRLHYLRMPGAGPPVVMIHGGPGVDSGYLVPDFEPLRAEHEILYYDQRGSGRSDLVSDAALLTMESHVADLEALRIFLRLERLTLVAHSFGPLLAAAYAIAHPDRVERMVFIGPLPPRRGEVWERFGAAIAARLQPEERARMSAAHERMLAGTTEEQITDACREFWEIGMRPRLADPLRPGVVKGDLCAAPGRAIRHGMAITNPATLASLGDWDYRPGLAKVTAPTLVIHGEAEAIPMDLVEEWTRVMPAASLLRVPGAAHFPYAEKPEIVWPALLGFLAQGNGRPAGPR